MAIFFQKTILNGEDTKGISARAPKWFSFSIFPSSVAMGAENFSFTTSRI